MFDLSREAKAHSMAEVEKLQRRIAELSESGINITDPIFARRLGEAIIACEVFVENTKHQHRTLCDIIAGKRA